MTRIADRIRQLKSSVLADRGARLAGVPIVSDTEFTDALRRYEDNTAFAVFDDCVGRAAVARQSHKLEVAGSNPAPATSFAMGTQDGAAGDVAFSDGRAGPDREGDACLETPASPKAAPHPTVQDPAPPKRSGPPLRERVLQSRNSESAAGATVVLSDRVMMILQLVEAAKGITTAEAVARGICAYAEKIGLPALAGVHVADSGDGETARLGGDGGRE